MRLFSLSAVVAGLIALSAPAQAATFDFDFNLAADNVSGQIVLPDGDGIGLKATSIIIAEAPSTFTTPFDIFDTISAESSNAFDVASGEITLGNIFVFGFSGVAYSDFQLIIDPANSSFIGVLTDVQNNTFTSFNLTVSSSAAVPAPAALPLLAAGIGLFGLMGWRRKRAV